MVAIKKIRIVVFGLSFIFTNHFVFCAVVQVGPEIKLKIDALKGPLLDVLKLEAQSLRADLEKNLAVAQKSIQELADVIKATPAVTPVSEASKAPDVAAPTAIPAVSQGSAPSASDVPKVSDVVVPSVVIPAIAPVAATPASEIPKVADAAASGIATPIEAHALIEVK